MNKLQKLLARAGVASTALVLSGVAMADPGTDAIAALETTATTYITAAFAVAVLVAAGFWGIGMMKKSFRKAG